MNDDPEQIVDGLLEGRQAALARAITTIENRDGGHREIVAELYDHAGSADVIGVTGRPGAGKSTLVDKVAQHYRERDETVGVIAVDPSSPYTGGAVLGDRVRMAANSGDMKVFFRSMSARGKLGGLSATTTDAVTALDAFGKDKVIVETVGAGQSEVDIVKTADTVAVLVPPGSGDDVQMLKAGILEIADVFVVNKADLDGSDETVHELERMLRVRDGSDWQPEIVETVATEGEGIADLVAAFDAHGDYLTAADATAYRQRIAEEIRTLLRSTANEQVFDAAEQYGGVDALADEVVNGNRTPYDVVEDILDNTP